MQPIVSVVLPVYNRAAYLGEAVESILAQTLGDLELILVDDGSTDATPDIIADYARRDRRIRSLRISRDGDRIASGAHAANAGIALAQGTYFARMDSDDIATSDRLATQLDFLRSAGLDICGGCVATFGEREAEIWYPETPEALRNELLFRAAIVNALMFMPAALMRRARYSETDAYEEYEFVTRMVFEAKIGNAPRVLHRFRQHDGSFSRQHRRAMLESILKLRFGYFFRLFPEAKVEDFRLIQAMATGFPLDDIARLKQAGAWLVRLSRVHERKARERMERRWHETCAAAAVPPDEIETVREPIAAQIAAAPA